jgi:hypothetical protein
MEKGAERSWNTYAPLKKGDKGCAERNSHVNLPVLYLCGGYYFKAQADITPELGSDIASRSRMAYI